MRNKSVILNLLLVSALCVLQQGCKPTAATSKTPSTNANSAADSEKDDLQQYEINKDDVDDEDGDDGAVDGDTSAQNNEMDSSSSQIVESATETSDIKESLEKTVSGMATILEAAQQASVIESETVNPDEIVILEAVEPVDIQPEFENQ